MDNKKTANRYQIGSFTYFYELELTVSTAATSSLGVFGTS
jgi:hypothetical protein